MAGNTVDRIRQIGHDIAHSWYFRVWALFWLVSALVAFSALIILSQSSNKAKQQEDIVLWVENATSIQYPRFHIRLDHRGDEIFYSTSCFFGTTLLSSMQCAPWGEFQPPLNQCIAFSSDSFTAQNDFMQFFQNHIYCTINTTGFGYLGNQMAVFELEGHDVFTMGGMAFEGTYFAPNNNAWILLEKNLFQPHSTKSQIQLWEKKLIYHSTIQESNYYNFTTMIGSFFVKHYDPTDTYNGWMTIGDIGGVSFFMVIIHTLVMIIFGLFLNNSSTFLAGPESKY